LPPDPFRVEYPRRFEHRRGHLVHGFDEHQRSGQFYELRHGDRVLVIGIVHGRERDDAPLVLFELVQRQLGHRDRREFVDHLQFVVLLEFVGFEFVLVGSERLNERFE
jgi:hypothetical protein